MEELLGYLKLKNQYFEKFLKVTRQFLQCSDEQKWNDISFFVDNRERILNIIRYFDHKIARLFNAQQMASVDVVRYRPEVKKLLQDRERLAKKIVKLDLELISTIDEMKSETIGELKRSLDSKRQLKSFDVSSEPLVSSHKPRKTA
ncbi:MAG: hypothetical protein KDD51_09885 [Bdellovibrionales bacterium]|nr:hypothetical protein [Bdellovibrionales bacterium]